MLWWHNLLFYFKGMGMEAGIFPNWEHSVGCGYSFSIHLTAYSQQETMETWARAAGVVTYYGQLTLIYLSFW